MTIAPWRWAISATSAGSGASVNPVIEKFDGMDAEDGLRAALGERRLEVGGAGAVRGADLDQLRAGPPDDLGDPDAAADLDELAARDDHPAATGQADRERERRGVVVGDERVLGAGQRDEVLLGGPDAGAAPAGLAVELEEEVASRQRGRGRGYVARPTARGPGSCGRSRPWR